MKRLLICLGLVGLAACAATDFHSEGLLYPKRGYEIKFTYPTIRAFINENWKTDNFEYDYGYHIFRRKSGKNYHGELHVDRNNDGTPEVEKGFFSDLVLRHTSTNGLIWLSTRDIMPRLKHSQYDLFLDNYLKSLCGPERKLSGDVFGYQEVTKEFEAVVLDKTYSKIGRYKAMVVTIAIGELNERSPNASYAIGKVRVLFAQIDGVIRRWANTPEGKKLKEIPGKVLMIAGYFNTLQYFDEYARDFSSFLKLIVFKEQELDKLQRIRALKKSKKEEAKKKD